MHSQLLADLLGHCVHINQSKVRGLRLDNISVSEKRRKECSDGPGRKERGEREKGGREEDKKQLMSSKLGLWDLLGFRIEE